MGVQLFGAEYRLQHLRPRAAFRHMLSQRIKRHAVEGSG